MPIHSLNKSHLAAHTTLRKLAPRQALAIHVKKASILLLREGRVWATLNGPHLRREGDCFLWPGQHLSVPGRQRLVLETLGDQPVVFEWLASAEGVAVRAQARLAAGFGVASLAASVVRQAGLAALAPGGPNASGRVAQR